MLRKILLFILLLLPLNLYAAPLSYQAGKFYCGITHPAELVAPVRRSTCEEQHIIQQQSGGSDQENVVWWSASSHVSTDVWSGQTWENNRPWLVFGLTEDADSDLEKAYMLGTFGLTWSIFQHSYRGKGESALILADFDGVSNALYFFSWIVNLPQKYLNKVAYIADTGRWYLLVDMLLAVFVLGIEGIIALASTIVGLAVGTLLNPIDTLAAIPGGLWLIIETLIAGVMNYAIGIYKLATSGLTGLILTPIAIIFSVLPLMAYKAFGR